MWVDGWMDGLWFRGGGVGILNCDGHVSGGCAGDMRIFIALGGGMAAALVVVSLAGAIVPTTTTRTGMLDC